MGRKNNLKKQTQTKRKQKPQTKNSSTKPKNDTKINPLIQLMEKNTKY